VGSQPVLTCSNAGDQKASKSRAPLDVSRFQTEFGANLDLERKTLVGVGLKWGWWSGGGASFSDRGAGGGKGGKRVGLWGERRGGVGSDAIKSGKELEDHASRATGGARIGRGGPLRGVTDVCSYIFYNFEKNYIGEKMGGG